jgi:hypothetical protein
MDTADGFSAAECAIRLNFQRTAACVTAQGELHFDKRRAAWGKSITFGM